MKLKCRPEDFRVEERLRLKLKPRGRYSVYRLEKRFWNTLDVVRDLEKKHGLRRVSRAGLKDRYSEAVQYLSIPGTGPKAVTEKNYSVRLAGMADQPVSRDLLLGNRFRVTLRALQGSEAEAILRALKPVSRFGFPNYYDEQRMGSARHGQGFIARKLVDGHFNGALKLYLATPSSADDARTRRAKAAVEQHWGDWRRCLDLVSPEAWPVIKYLVYHPHDLAGAVKLVPKEMLELFVSAYQAWLWNEVMAGVLEQTGVAVRWVGYSLGRFAFYEELGAAHLKYLARLKIPAPGPGVEFRSERVANVAGEVLGREGLRAERLKLKVRVPGVFFKPYERQAIVFPGSVSASGPEPDELYPGHSKVVLSFFLGPGSFATVLIRRLAMGVA